MNTIYHQVLIDAPREVVFDAITLQDGLSKWWIDQCIAKPELGFVNVFEASGFFVNKMKIVDFKQDAFLEWKCIESIDEWLGTGITFNLVKVDDHTKLDFKHAGWRNITEFYAVCNFHWGRHLLMLKALCETGLDQVNPEFEIQENLKAKLN